MRIQLLSDLHLERYPDFVPLPGTDVDVLVLAGDIGSYQAGSDLATDDFGLGRFSPERFGHQWPRVLYVPGNHEFDSLEFEPTRARLRQTCDELGIEWLDREVIEIGTVRFVGTTLWSDFDALAVSESTVTKQLQARELSLDCQGWLRQALAVPFDGTTVVVTHFAPSLRSADPRYGLTPGTAGFCNAMDDFLPAAQVWMHGHLHCPNDYVVSGEADGRPFSCRVVANTLGYRGTGEQEGFQEGFVVEVP